MVSLDDKVRALAVTAGWKPPRPEKDGSYRFRLEDGLDLKIFSPDGRWCFLLAELLSFRKRTVHTAFVWKTALT